MSEGDVLQIVSGRYANTAPTPAMVGAQPIDADLTAIAALTTTSYGRAFLALADAAAARTALSLGTAATATGTTAVRGETFTGTGAQTAFTLAHTPTSGVSVYLAGVRVDVTLSTNTITFSPAPILNATIRVDYEYAS